MIVLTLFEIIACESYNTCCTLTSRGW